MRRAARCLRCAVRHPRGLGCGGRARGAITAPLPGHNHGNASTTTSAAEHLKDALQRAFLAPIRAFRPAYLPLLMVYFAYGALGLIAVADSFWVKKELTLTPAALAQLGVWLTLPWAMKMVFGELVDTVAILGSQRRVYVYIGATLMAVGADPARGRRRESGSRSRRPRCSTSRRSF